MEAVRTSEMSTSTRLHGATSQKAVIFIFTADNLKSHVILHSKEKSTHWKVRTCQTFNTILEFSLETQVQMRWEREN
jgi:hypothetical protein